MYLELLKQKARFDSSKGSLSMEQLFDLSLTDLDQIAVKLDDQYESSKKSKSFLSKRTKKDKVAKMKLNFVLDVMNYKQEEEERLTSIKNKKEFNNKIGAIIERKRHQELESLSLKDLEKLLK